MADVQTTTVLQKQAPLSMLELYAGIGGMRTAAIEIGLNVGAIHPFEINPSALEAYTHNFLEDKHPSASAAHQEHPQLHSSSTLTQASEEFKQHKQQQSGSTITTTTNPSSKGLSKSPQCKRVKTAHGVKRKSKARNLLSLTVKEWIKLNPDLLTMSPPCQPFTRQGLQLDTADRRNSSLHHVLSVLSAVPRPPARILLENVKGFETSRARSEVVAVLQRRGYSFKELLLCPSQLGVPNSRLRYYLLAVRQPDEISDTSGASSNDISSTSCTDSNDVSAADISSAGSDAVVCSSSNGASPDSNVELSSTVTSDGSSPQQPLAPQVSRQFPLCTCLPWAQQQKELVNEAQSSSSDACLCGRCGKRICLKATRLLEKFHSLDIRNGAGDSSNGRSGDGGVDGVLSEKITNFSDFSEITPMLGNFLERVRKEFCVDCASVGSHRCFQCGKGSQSSLSNAPHPHHLSAADDSEMQNEIAKGSSVCESNSSEAISYQHAMTAETGSGILCSRCCDHSFRYLLKEKVLLRYGRLLDVVENSSRRSCCFTKGYGRLVEGTGSVFNPSDEQRLDEVFTRLKELNEEAAAASESVANSSSPINGITGSAEACQDSRENLDSSLTNDTSVSVSSISSTTSNSGEIAIEKSDHQTQTSKPASVTKSPSAGHTTPNSSSSSSVQSSLLLSLGLRYFSPIEGLRLMGFPAWFQFPSSLTDRQQYQLIGNSVNVLVVAVLLALLEEMDPAVPC